MTMAGEVDNKFAVEAEVEQVVLEIVIVDGVDRVDESDKVDKHMEIALS